MVEVSTSILTVEPEGAIQKFYNLETAHTDYFHIDVMDAKFVEKDTSKMMLEYAQTIKQISNLPLDVHLMVEDVKKYIEEYVPLQPNRITFHYEAVKEKKELMECIEQIKQENIKVGISIKPGTKLEEIYEILPYIHMVLIMTVEPGKGGQKLIPETLEKIKQLKQYIIQNQIEVDIEADGGINQETIKQVKEAGVDIVVAGSAIINAKNYAQAIQELKKE